MFINRWSILLVNTGDLLPWQHCNNTWNTESCISITQIPENCDNCINFENRTSAAEEFYESVKLSGAKFLMNLFLKRS